MSWLNKREFRTPFTVINILGFDNFVVFFFLTLFRLGNQFGSINDHIFGQFIDLVSDFTKTINALFFGFPEVVRDGSEIKI